MHLDDLSFALFPPDAAKKLSAVIKASGLELSHTAFRYLNTANIQ